MKVSIPATRLRQAGLLLAALAVAVGLAACGSSNSSSSAAASAGSSGSTTSSASGARHGLFGDPAQRAKLAACLKQHGVTLPARPANRQRPRSGYGFGLGFGGAPGAAGSAKIRTALRECGVNFRAGFGARFTPTQRKAQIEAFSKCVAQHGYKLPAPNLTGNGPVYPASIEKNAKFQTAARACATLLRPSGGPGAAGAPGSGSGAPAPAPASSST